MINLEYYFNHQGLAVIASEPENWLAIAAATLVALELYSACGYIHLYAK